MSNDSSEYQGWSNYQTWATMLWISNDEGMQNESQEAARRLASGRTPAQAMNALEDWLRDWIGEACEEADRAGLVADLLTHALNQVNFREMAQSILEEIPAEPEVADDADDEGPTELDTFTQAYIETALWAGGEELEGYDASDIAPEALAELVEDCRAFQEEAWEMIEADLANAGHHFFLTRNRHGAGFWDGDWQDGKVLTDMAHVYGTHHPYVGDDGQRIYFHN